MRTHRIKKGKLAQRYINAYASHRINKTIKTLLRHEKYSNDK